MQDNMLSLFDYLGKPAGKELGAQVAAYAKVRKAKHNIRHVSNPKYTGYVMMYTKEFLDEFFTVKNNFTSNYNEYQTEKIF